MLRYYVLYINVVLNQDIIITEKITSSLPSDEAQLRLKYYETLFALAEEEYGMDIKNFWQVMPQASSPAVVRHISRHAKIFLS